MPDVSFQAWIRTDFNAAKRDGSIDASARFAVPAKPDLWDFVTLYDGEGNEADAVVTAVEGNRISCGIDWATWRVRPAWRLIPAFGDASPGDRPETGILSGDPTPIR